MFNYILCQYESLHTHTHRNWLIHSYVLVFFSFHYRYIYPKYLFSYSVFQLSVLQSESIKLQTYVLIIIIYGRENINHNILRALSLYFCFVLNEPGCFQNIMNYYGPTQVCSVIIIFVMSFTIKHFRLQSSLGAGWDERGRKVQLSSCFKRMYLYLYLMYFYLSLMYLYL